MPSKRYFAPSSYLPHDRRINVLQSITFRLHNSLPDFLERKLIQERSQEGSPVVHFDDLSPTDRRQYHEVLDARCADDDFLHNPDIAQVVLDQIFLHDHVLYDVIAWCIMPNHVHLILFVKTDLSKIMYRIKGTSARYINSLRNTTGKRLWAHGYFDHYIRSPQHYQAAIDYVLDNPRKANVSDRFTGIIQDYEHYANFIFPYIQQDNRLRTPEEPWLYPL